MRNWRLWIILLVALIVRLALLANGWIDRQRLTTPDSRDYLVLAHNLHEPGKTRFYRSEGYLWNVIPPTLTPELFRTPGYPTFLWMTRAVPGPPLTSTDAAQDSPRARFVPSGARRVPWSITPLIVQVLLDVALVCLAFLLGRVLCSERVGLLAAAFQAITPVAAVAAVRVLSDSLFAVLLTGSILLLVWYLKTDKKLLVFSAGILLGLACLVRPIGGPFAVIAFVAILAARWRRPQWAALFLVGVAVCVGPWIGRNYVRARYVGLSSVGDYNLFFFNAMALVESDPKVTLTPVQQALRMAGPDSPASLPAYRGLSSPDSARAWRREGLAIIGKHPLRYGWLHLRTTMNTFLPAATDVLEVCGVTSGGKGTLKVIRTRGVLAGVRHYFGGRTWPVLLAVPLVLITLLKYVGVVLGAVKYLRLRMGAAGWLVLITIAWFALVPGPVAHARFRVPIAPLLSVVAAAGFVWVVEARRARRARQGPPGTFGSDPEGSSSAERSDDARSPAGRG